MGVNKKVFASRAEQENFYKLKKNWEGREGYKIYHNLPFLIIFNIDDLVNVSLHEIEKSRLKKTSIDYILCNENDEPLVCIDFDGLGQGFNIGSQYYSNKKVDTWRREITELKLKVAHSSLFPYFVVASRHFNEIEGNLKLTIVDGIIGSLVSQRSFSQRFHNDPFPESAGLSQEEYSQLSPEDQYNLFKKWAICLEVDTELENNPISKEVSRLSTELNAWSYSVKYLCLPTSNYRENNSKKIFLGARVTIHSKTFGDIDEQVYLPNFKVPGFSASCLTDLIARLLALSKLKKLSKDAAIT